MRFRSTTRVGALVGLALATVLTAAACVPDAPAPTTTSTTSTPSTTSTTMPSDPVAVAAATPTAPGYFGLPVAFSSAGSTASAGHGIASYLWDFGDGSAPSTDANPTHTYTQPGPFTVSLTVTDDQALTGGTTTAVAQPAPAGDVTVAPNPVAIPANPGSAMVKTWWNNQAANKLMFVDVCKKSIADPTFNVAVDCSLLGSITPNGTASGSGVADLSVFRGQDPAEEAWGCFAAGDTAPGGVAKYTTCYVRVTNNVRSNNLEAKEAAFTISPS